MEDYIIRVTAGNGSVMGFFATTTNTANEMQTRHNTSPVVSAGLGRLITATTMIGQTLKDDNHLVTVSLKGDGPMQGIIATGDKNGNVKGYPFVNDVDIPLKPSGKLDVGGAIGFGNLSLIKDIGLKDAYTGNIPLISGEVADDLTYYFAKSEQIPTSVALGVLVDTDYSIKQSGGFIIQLLPNTPDEVIDVIELKLQHLPPITTLMEEGKTPEDIAEIVLGELGVKVNERTEVQFKCDCSEERVEKALISIGKEEIQDILNTDKQAELNCHFCNTSYTFDEQHLKDLLERI